MENRTDKRAQRGGLPLLFALILGLSLLLHTAGMLAMGGWHGIADPAFLKGDLSRYPDYARAMADLYRAVAVCAAGAGDAMGQPTDGELTIVNRSEAQLFDGAMQKETGAPAGSYWQGQEVNLGLDGAQVLEELRDYLGSILESDGQSGIGRVAIAVIGPDGNR